MKQKYTNSLNHKHNVFAPPTLLAPQLMSMGKKKGPIWEELAGTTMKTAVTFTLWATDV